MHASNASSRRRAPPRFPVVLGPMSVGYWISPSAFMVSWTFGLAPIRAMNALMLGHFARSILWTLVQLITVNR